MSLYVTLTINGYRIDSIDIVNQGPVNGEYVDGDWEGGPGVRLYQWTIIPPDGKPVVGTVHHRRSEGAHTLAAKVLDAIAAREGLNLYDDPSMNALHGGPPKETP